MGYNLDEDVYDKLYKEYNLSKNNEIKYFDKNAITEASFLDINYKEWGRICFFGVKVNLNLLYGISDGLTPSDMIDYNSFYDLLTKAYVKTFGQEVASAILKVEENRCDYIEYLTYLKVGNADLLMRKLSKCKFSKEQLDRDSFDSYRIKNAQITFTINQIDGDTVRLCAKCPNTVLKRIYKVEGLSGVPVEQALNKKMAADILFKQVVKYMKPNIPDELSRESIFMSL